LLCSVKQALRRGHLDASLQNVLILPGSRDLRVQFDDVPTQFADFCAGIARYPLRLVAVGE